MKPSRSLAESKPGVSEAKSEGPKEIWKDGWQSERIRAQSGVLEPGGEGDVDEMKLRAVADSCAWREDSCDAMFVSRSRLVLLVSLWVEWCSIAPRCVVHTHLNICKVVVGIVSKGIKR